MKHHVLRWVAVFAALICFGIAAFFMWQVYQQEKEYKEGDDVYALIEQMAAQSSTEDAPEETPGHSPSPEDFSEETAVEEQRVEPEPTPNPEAAIIPDINFDALDGVGSNLVAWLYSPETVINYPVAQGADNFYYLNHLADGTENGNGCLFIDWKNAPDFSDENTVIYGHHMQSGKMFASLVNYADQSYFEEHPVVYLTTRTGKYKIELFSGYTTDRNSSAYTLRFATKHEFADWLREVSDKSDFRTSMRLSTEDHIVTLSTCAYSFYDARYVVHGRLTLVEERSGN